MNLKTSITDQCTPMIDSIFHIENMNNYERKGRKSTINSILHSKQINKQKKKDVPIFMARRFIKAIVLSIHLIGLRVMLLGATRPIVALENASNGFLLMQYISQFLDYFTLFWLPIIQLYFGTM